MVKKSFEKWSSRNQTYFRMRFKNDSWIFFQFKVFFLNQQKILRSSSSDQNLNLNGCRPIIRVIWKWPDPCHVNPRGMTCIPLSFTPRIYLTNQRHVQQNDCITNFYEKFNSRFQTNQKSFVTSSVCFESQRSSLIFNRRLWFFSQNWMISSLFELEMSFL